MTWHNNKIAQDEVWIKSGGDYGGDSFKIMLQVANIINPNAKQNMHLACMVDCKDNQEKLRSVLLPMNNQITNLQSMKGQEKKTRLFVRWLISHLSLDREGRWDTTDDFATSFLHFFLFSTAFWDLVSFRPVHFLMLFSHLFPCLLCLLPLSPCLARWFGQTWWTWGRTVPLQFASPYDGQVFVWSDCLVEAERTKQQRKRQEWLSCYIQQLV